MKIQCIHLVSSGVGFASSSQEYFVAFAQNYINDASARLSLFISSVEPGPVQVTVETLRDFKFTGFATNQNTLEVAIPNSFQLFSGTERDKGIWIKAENQNDIVVYGLNYRNFTSDAFLALPCNHLPVDYYEYYGVSYPDTKDGYDYFLVVACEDNTTVHVGRSTVVLSRMQTYFWRNSSVTGRRLLSNKPVSVFTGNRCAFVPYSIGFCDHMTLQVPPTVTWGTHFLSASLAGRESGDLYRIVSSRSATTVTVNCTTFENELVYNLSAPGSWDEFTTPAQSYCSIISNKPLLLAQFALGFDHDNVGDPFVMLITPIEQYSNDYVFPALPGFSTNFITVYVTPEDYEPDNILIDDTNLESHSWNTVYCSDAEICGYITYLNLTAGDHRLYHAGAFSRIGMSAYGFGPYNSYGYPGAINLDIIQSKLQLYLHHVFCSINKMSSFL